MNSNLKGVCRIKEKSTYVFSCVTILCMPDQTWNFEYQIIDGKTYVDITRDIVKMHITEEEFKDDWDICIDTENPFYKMFHENES
jgi:hypothetical protein